MRRACAVALALSICACRHVGPLPGDPDSGAETDGITDPEPIGPGDLLWAAAIETGMASDVVALADGDLLAAGTNGDGAAFYGADSGEIAVDPAGAFLARYTSAGEIVAVESPIRGRALTAHADRADDGSMFLSGAFADMATFVGTGSPGDVSFAPQGDDAYVLRRGDDATSAWVMRLAGPGYDSAIDVVALADGGGVAVGTFGLGSTNAGEPGIGTIVDALGGETPLVTAGGGDLFAVALAADGALAWSAIAGGEGEDRAYAIDVRADGSLVIAGEYGGGEDVSCGAAGYTAAFAGDEGVAIASAGAADGFVAAYTANGEVQWARGVGGPCMDWIRDVVALEDGTIVAAGVIEGPAVFGTGEANETEIDCGALASCDGMQRVFLAAFDANGDLEWVRTSGFCADDASIEPARIRADELAASADGALAIAGGYQGTCGFGPGEPGATELPYSNIAFDPFLAAFAADGALQWVATGASACDDEATAVTFTADGSLGAAGFYSNWWGYEEAWGCYDPIAFGAGEPNATVLPDPGTGLGSGPQGFVAVFASE